MPNSPTLVLLSVLAIGVLIALLLWLIFLVVRATRKNFALATKGRITNATVIRREAHGNFLLDLLGMFFGAGSSSQYYLHYQFALPTAEGQTLIQSKNATWKHHYDKYVEGSTIEICYVPGEPQVSQFAFAVVWFPRSLEQARKDSRENDPYESDLAPTEYP
ncbi:MAG: hypothetical protein KF726_28715 [Anaerolineae bacterium]|nr:hypothetical protein [Anaerolineae bacterium]